MNIYIHHLFDQLATFCQMCFIYFPLSCFLFFLKKKFWGGLFLLGLWNPISSTKDWTCARFPHHGIIIPKKWTIPGNFLVVQWLGDFPDGSDSKASAYNVGDPGSIPGSGRSPGEGNGNPLQYSAWKIPWTEEPGRLQSMGWQRAGHD